MNSTEIENKIQEYMKTIKPVLIKTLPFIEWKIEKFAKMIYDSEMEARKCPDKWDEYPSEDQKNIYRKTAINILSELDVKGINTLWV